MNRKHRDALNLLKTAKGQIEGVIRMIEEERYCIDISKQLLSLIALLRKTNEKVLKAHIETCVKEAVITGEVESKLEDLEEILGYLV
ncbi:metal-sensing transcriptional repressor [bacterium]|nr:metal-sensing transcriptional repressor [bacterium]